MDCRQPSILQGKGDKMHAHDLHVLRLYFGSEKIRHSSLHLSPGGVQIYSSTSPVNETTAAAQVTRDRGRTLSRVEEVGNLGAEVVVV